jgi:4-hydroxy-4-methyl-2-oxoglutarate aldolase
MRDPFDIYPETSPADALDALYGLVGEGGAPRSVNGLAYLGEGAMFGRAVTLRSLPSRHDHNATVSEKSTAEWGAGPYPYALSLCNERSVLVLEARGMTHFAAGGGTGLASLLGRRAAGLLTDGQIRDSDNLARHAKETGTKLMTGGYTLQYGTERMLNPAEVNVPVAIQDTLVLPGDYVFANADGAIIIPEAMAEEVLETAVVLARSAAVMEDMLIDQRGIIGIDLKGITDEVIQEMKNRFTFSDRQLELWEKNVTGIA